MTAEAAATQLDRDPDATRTQLARLRTLAREALDELRALILGLRPPELERDGLAGALAKEVDMLRHVHGIGIELHVAGASETADVADRDPAVLRIVHEALYNAIRHARAGHVSVWVSGQENGALVVEVNDDGIGFDPERAELRSRHLGLTSMEERAHELGGRLAIRSLPGAGTTVRLEVPT